MAGSVVSRSAADASARGVKRPAEELTAGITFQESVEAFAKEQEPQQLVPLGEIRDVLMDHVLGTLESDLRYTVLFVCEDVSDLHADVEDTEAEPTRTDLERSQQQEDTGNDNATAMPFLTGVDGDIGYAFQSRLSQSDSIPHCDATLLKIPISKRDIEKEKKAAKKAIKMRIKKFKKTNGATPKPSAEFYVLDTTEYKCHLPGIPLDDDHPNASDFVSTKPAEPTTDTKTQPLLFALDCEMCRTTKGVELTRITVVDADEKVVIDEYVRPKNPIVDYCTQYSGITFEIMDATTTTLSDIQQRFLECVPADAILVGHSIENDLMALKIRHARVIDTVAMYPHPKGLPFRSALRFLSSTYLKKSIQTGTDGHCSIEDAVATLQLAQLKIKHGPTFPSIDHEYKQKKVLNELHKAKKSALIVDSARAGRSLSAGVACIIACEANDKVVQTVVHQLTTGFPPHLTWARVRGANRAEITGYLHEIQASLPDQSCVVVVLAGDVTKLRELHKLRTTRGDPRCSLPWDKAQQTALERVAHCSQKGLVQIFCK